MKHISLCLLKQEQGRGSFRERFMSLVVGGQVCVQTYCSSQKPPQRQGTSDQPSRPLPYSSDTLMTTRYSPSFIAAKASGALSIPSKRTILDLMLWAWANSMASCARSIRHKAATTRERSGCQHASKFSPQTGAALQGRNIFARKIFPCRLCGARKRPLGVGCHSPACPAGVPGGGSGGGMRCLRLFSCMQSGSSAPLSPRRVRDGDGDGDGGGEGHVASPLPHFFRNPPNERLLRMCRPHAPTLLLNGLLTWLSRPVPAGQPTILLRVAMSCMGLTSSLSLPAIRTSVPFLLSPVEKRIMERKTAQTLLASVYFVHWTM